MLTFAGGGDGVMGDYAILVYEIGGRGYETNNLCLSYVYDVQTRQLISIIS